MKTERSWPTCLHVAGHAVVAGEVLGTFGELIVTDDGGLCDAIDHDVGDTGAEYPIPNRTMAIVHAAGLAGEDLADSHDAPEVEPAALPAGIAAAAHTRIQAIAPDADLWHVSRWATHGEPDAADKVARHEDVIEPAAKIIADHEDDVVALATKLYACGRLGRVSVADILAGPTKR